MIHGFFEPHPRGLAALPRLAVSVYLPTISSQWAEVSFLIDTGATVTSPGPVDAVTHVGIPWLALIRPQLWPDQEDFGGIGGSCLHYIQDAEYLFRHDGWNEPAAQCQDRHYAADTATAAPEPLGAFAARA